MTYNFDPDRWYEMRLALLEARLQRAEIDRAQFEAALDDLNRQFEDMVDRLDGTYEIPSSDGTS